MMRPEWELSDAALRRRKYRDSSERSATMMLNRGVGQRLRLFREACGLQMKDVAGDLGISVQRWSNYEAGKRPLDMLLALTLSDRYRFTLDWLFKGSPEGLYLAAEEKYPATALRSIEGDRRA